jgi:alkanesulfonate monooxygenase SsuD/methylene tetrahydromethanopterin reductase-like flavin-dependent oxidoreductase (luciferase family)
MFTEESPSYAGRHYQLDGAWNSPRPVRSTGIPLMIGGGGERRTLRIVARHADLSNVAGDPRLVARRMELLDGYCREVGRDPAAVRRTTLSTMRVCASGAEAEAAREELVAAGWPAGMVVVGPPEVVVAEAEALFAAGLDEVIVNLPGATTLPASSATPPGHRRPPVACRYVRFEPTPGRRVVGARRG